MSHCVAKNLSWRWVAGLLASLALWAAPARADEPWAPSSDPKDAPPALDREFRGVWVASVANIDWPSKRGLPIRQQREEMVRLLDAARSINLNAILLQVRPACDALYRSDLEPWSEFLTGRSGQAPDDSGYDPLLEWIREAHARGLELHAWMNPFRARHFESKQPDAASHISKMRPDWVKSYDSYLWLDPGEEGAREHTLRVALDIVSRYDIDGLHFDDYFYPYPKEKLPFPDDPSYNRYVAGGGSLARPDWRRRNIDDFVRTLYQRVKKAKPNVKVGVSPFGIWRPGFPPPVRGFDSYDGLSGDARRWVREGWLDYVSPQLYWKLEAPQQPFARLLDWWVDQNDQQRHVWPGLNASRVLAAGALGKDAKPAASWEPSDVLAQIDATRRAGGATGTVLFSMAAISENRRGLADQLRQQTFLRPALVPPSPWLRPSAGLGSQPLPALAAPSISITDDPRGGLLTLTPAPLPLGQTETAKWWGLWIRRAGAWSFTLRPVNPAGKPETLAIASLVGAASAQGEGGVDGAGVFSIDPRGVATPTTVWSRAGGTGRK